MGAGDQRGHQETRTAGATAHGRREWRPKGEPVEVEDRHFFTGSEVGSVPPLVAGTRSRDYPKASRLLTTADAGGSNGCRYRVWKSELATLAAETGLAITLCHFPPGTSKWNKSA